MNFKKNFILLAIMSIFLASIFTYLGVVKQKEQIVTKEKIVQRSDIKIAIVNEDSGTDYNGDNLDMGALLVKSFSETGQYNVEVVSRAIAEKGLENENYQLMVILPNNFSKQSLALEDSKPKQAIFQYKIKSEKQNLLKQAQQAVSDLKNSFNKDIIYIYFTSIVGNLQNAQNQVSNVVEKQKTSLSTYQGNLINPLKNFSSQFHGITNNSNEIANVYNQFNTSIHNTNNSFSTIASVEKDYGTEIATITDMQKGWNENIKNRENSILEYDTAFSMLSIDLPLEILSQLKNNQLKQIVDKPTWNHLLKDIEGVKNKLNNLKNTVITRNEEVKKYLSTTYKSKIVSAVNDSISDEQNQNVKTLGFLSRTLRENIDNEMKAYINRTTILDEQSIDRLEIGNEDKHILKNVNNYLKFKFNYTNVAQTSESDKQLLNTKNYIQTKKQAGSFTVPTYEGTISKITLDVPSNFYFVSINGEEQTDKLNKVTLANNINSVTFEAKLKENVAINDISIFEKLPVNLIIETTESFDNITREKLNQLKDEIAIVSNEIGSLENLDSFENLDFQALENLLSEKITTKIEPDLKTVKRTYDLKNTYILANDYSNLIFDIKNSTIKDLKNYFAIIAKVKSLYGIDLTTTAIESVNDVNHSNDSLYAKLSMDNISDILVEIVSNTLIKDVKDILVVPVEFSENAEKIEEKINELEKQINTFQETLNLTNQKTEEIINESTKIKEQLESKPNWKETKVFDNTSLIETSMNINKDLIALMKASKTLMENTSSNKEVSETINNNLKILKESVNELEETGKKLSSQVDGVGLVLETEYDDNKSFLNAFVNVMSNTKSGNSKNSEVYNYLSNPIGSENIDTVLATSKKELHILDYRSSFVIILIAYILSLFIAYLFENYSRRVFNENKDERSSISNVKKPILFIVGVVVAVGVLMALVIFAKLSLTVYEFILILSALFAIVSMFILLNIYVLYRFKATGMLLIITFLVIYIISSTYLFEESFKGLQQSLSYVTPLYYGEQWLNQILNHKKIILYYPLIVVIILVVTFMLNISVYKKIENE